MTSKTLVYVVSSDPALTALVRNALAGKAELVVYQDARTCQAELAKYRPDLLAIDLVSLAEEGFALHRALRDDFDLADLYQLLLCGADQAGRAGFEPDDFLVAPVTDVTLGLKLAASLKTLDDKRAAREQMTYAQQVAFTSMSAMGELGVVMQFLSKSFACHNIQAVARLAVDSLRQYELEGAVYIIWEGDHLALPTAGDELAGDRLSLIQQRRALGRLLEIERNLVVNFEHVTVLVSNLPEDDNPRLGRIRDNIATLAEGIESRIQGLLLEHDNLLKQQGIGYAVGEIRDSIVNLNARQIADHQNSQQLINDVIDDFEDAFLRMGLHIDHERMLINDLVELRRKIGEIIASPGGVNEKLQIVIAALATLAGEVEE